MGTGQGAYSIGDFYGPGREVVLITSAPVLLSIAQSCGHTELQGSLGKVLELDAQEEVDTSHFCQDCEKEESCAAPGTAVHQ